MVNKANEITGARWKAARRAKGYTLAQVSAWLDVSGHYISMGSLSRLETGRADPKSLGLLIPLLCQLYGINPNDIYGQSEENT